MKRLIVILFMVSLLKAQNFGDVILEDTFGLYTPGSGNGVAWDSHDNKVIIAGYKRAHGSAVKKGWLIKYDPLSDDTIWSRFYGNYKYDFFNDVAYDPSGYYVAVGASATSSSVDFWILKLTTDGNVEWQGIYGNPSLYDEAKAVTLDSAGDYVVVGYERDSDGVDKAAILKIDANTNDTLWTRVYNTPDTSRLYDVFIDSNGYYVGVGEIYEAGYGWKMALWVIAPDNGDIVGGDEYGASGSNHRGRCGLMSSDNNFIIAGYTDVNGDKDYEVLKINYSDGSILWDSTYAISGDQEVWEITRINEYVYVGGYSSEKGNKSGFMMVIDDGLGGVVDMDLNGLSDVNDWEKSVVVYQDTIFSVGGSENEHLLTHIRHSQNIRDSHLKDLSLRIGYEDKAYAIAIDSSGNYIIVGNTHSPDDADHWQILAVKYDPVQDRVLWWKIYSQRWGDSKANKVIVDIDGYYAISGYTVNSSGNKDVWVLKLNPNTGDTVWTGVFGGDSDEVAMDIIEDVSGHYAVAGYTTSYGAGREDGWLLVLNASTGDTLYTKTYGGSEYDVFNAISEDNGYYILAGVSSELHGYGDDWILKVDAQNGDTVWQRYYGDLQGQIAYDVIVDRDGNYVVSGKTYSVFTIDDVWVLKIKSDNGDTIWTKSYGGSDAERGFSIKEDKEGFYVIAGFTRSYGAGSSDYWALKLDPENGATLGQKTFGGAGDDMAECVSVDDSNHYVITGFSNSTTTGGYDFYTVKIYQGDNLPPVFDSITQLPNDTTLPFGPYQVDVKITDNLSGVDRGRLYWKSSEDADFSYSSLTYNTNNWWGASISEINITGDSALVLYYVDAYDSAGNYGVSDTLSFWVIKPDTEPPLIDSLTQVEKDTTIPHGPYEVRVKVWDEYRGVNNVRLYWKDEASSTFTESFMDSLSGNWWVDSIPEQVLNNDSTVIYYYVIAEDNAGNMTYSDTLSFWVIDPDTLPPEIDSLTKVLSDTTLPFGPYEVRVKSWDEYGSIQDIKFYWKNDTMSDFTVGNMAYLGGDWWIDSIPQQEFAADSMSILYYVVSEDSAGNSTVTDTMSFWMVKPDTEPPLIDSLTQVEKDTTIPHGPYEVRVKAWDEYRGVNNVRLYWKDEASSTFTESLMDSLGGNWWVDSIPEQVLNNDSTVIYYYVIAEDNAGNMSYSDTLSFWVIDPDTTVPEIDSLTQIERDNNPPYGPYDVWSKVKDEYRGLADVELYWKKESQPAFIQVSMSGTSGDWWYGSIPEQTLDTDSIRIMYYIKATDLVGNASYSDTLSFYIVKPDTMAPQIDSLTEVDNDSTAPYGPYEVRVKVTDLYKKAGSLFGKGVLKDIKYKETSQVKLYWKIETEAVFNESSMAYLGNNWWIDSIPEESFSTDSIRVLYYVSAQDDAGNTSYSDTLSFWLIKLDTVKPVIDTVTQMERDSVPPYGPYEVWVNATDNKGVKYTRLYWKKASQPAFVQIDMNHATGNWWVDSIPEQTLTQDSILILYYAEAVDSSGNTGVSDTFGFWIVSPDTTPPVIDSLTQVENDTMPPYGPYEVRVKVTDSRKGQVVFGIYKNNKHIASLNGKDAFLEKSAGKGVRSVKLYWKNDQDAVFHESDMALQSGNWWIDTIPQQSPATHTMSVMYYVKATDEAGNTAYSDTLSFVIVTPDTTPPVIDSLTQLENDTTFPHGPYNIDVRVTDNYRGVYGVTLYWRTSLMSNFSHDAMVNISGNWWHDTIPQIDFTSVDSVEVFYFVTAEDSSSNMSVSDTVSFWVINPDTTPPEIDSLTQIENDSTSPYGPYEVRVKVVDSYTGVDSVKLLYKKQTQPAFVESNMSLVVQNWWVDTIPEQSLQAEDSVIVMLYYIYAVDNAGNEVVSDTLSFELINPEYLIEEGKSITQFGVKIPSVCRNRLSFVFMAPSSDIYSVKVYSVNGRLLFNDRGKIKRGLTLVNLPLYKGGLYFVRIKLHGKTYHGKVLLVK